MPRCSPPHRREKPESAPLRDLVQAAAGWERPVLPVRGADLVARGLAGPAVGKALTFVERWWIAQDFRPGREAALEKLEEAIALVRGDGVRAAPTVTLRRSLQPARRALAACNAARYSES